VADLVLPSLPPAPGEDFFLLLSLRGQGLGPQALEVSSGLAVTACPHPDRLRRAGEVCFRLRAAEPGMHEVKLGSIAVDIWVPDPAARELVILRDEGGRPCVRISPEIAITTGGEGLRRTSIPLTVATAATPGVLAMAGRRRIDGVEVRVHLAIGPAAGLATPWNLTVTPTAPIPVLDLASPVFTLGSGLGQGPSLAVLPGIEMRTRCLPQILLPDPRLLSWRCACLEEEGVTVVVTWDAPGATPRFAAPDVRAGTAVSSLSLHVPPRPGAPGVSGDTRLASAAADLAPLAWSGQIVVASSRIRALAAVAGILAPAPPFVDAPEVLVRAVAALDGPFRGPQGVTLPRLGAPAGEEYFDPRSCLSLLACSRLGLSDRGRSARAQVDRYLAGPEAPVPLGVGLLFPECLDRAVATLARESRELVARVRPDGTWPPELPPGCHAPDPRPFSRSASAIAKPAALLLWAAAFGLGGTDRVAASLERLRDPELLPTGGQGWEFAPDVPEILGAAHAAEAFLLAYELGVDPAGLDRAADWLMLGLTFFRLESGHPFACCPALGVTRSPAGGLLWYLYAPDDWRDWRGASCPWIGLRFADTLERFLAAARRHSQEARLADALKVMATVSRGALAHALTFMGPEGSLIDGLDLRTGVETEPLYRAPLDIAWHALRMLSACPDPFLAHQGELTAAGAGSFAADGDALVFEAALPGPQAVLVAGPGEVRQDGRARPLREILGGLSWSEIDGGLTVRIQPL
jgi:hypothetical protein